MDDSLNPENQIKRTRLSGADEDRISSLPDSVLQHILAFVSTKDAVRTSTLSIRWQNLWKLVPCLDLESVGFPDINDFLDFMDKFIDIHGNSDLQKFKLMYDFSWHENSRFKTCFKTWIETAVMCKLEHLDIHNYPGNYYHGVKMPPSLYTCKTLVVLKLQHVVLDIEEIVSLPSLKTIDLRGVLDANDSAFKSFISGCPVLEELSIVGRPKRGKDNLKCMCICSPTIKRLAIERVRCGDGKERRVVIDAPHLEYLSLRDRQSESFVLKNHGLSFKADIDVIFNVEYGDKLEPNDVSKINSIRTFLAGISNVKILSISCTTLEILSQYSRLEALPQFNYLIHLETRFIDPELKMLPALLECCPNLKTFILESAASPKSNPLTMSSAAPRRMLSALESITLGEWIPAYAIGMDLIRSFLEYSPVLKQMNLYISKHPDPKEESIILKKLLTFPRRSTACRVIILEGRKKVFPLFLLQLKQVPRQINEKTPFVSEGSASSTSD